MHTLSGHFRAVSRNKIDQHKEYEEVDMQGATFRRVVMGVVFHKEFTRLVKEKTRGIVLLIC